MKEYYLMAINSGDTSASYDALTNLGLYTP